MNRTLLFHFHVPRHLLAHYSESPHKSDKCIVNELSAIIHIHGFDFLVDLLIGRYNHEN